MSFFGSESVAKALSIYSSRIPKLFIFCAIISMISLPASGRSPAFF